MNPTIGILSLARTTFDMALAREQNTRTWAALEGAGLALTGSRELCTSAGEVQAAAQELAREDLDLLIVLQATFADSTLVSGVAQMIPAPLLLWALPEERTGARLRLNSFCGVNLAAHALKRAGVWYDYVYAQPEDPAAQAKVDSLARAGRARRTLARARIGRIGDNPDGFEPCTYNGEALSRFGLEVVPIELPRIFEAARAQSPQAVDGVRQRLGTRLAGLDDLDQPATAGTLSAYLALRDLSESQRLDGLAVRCWPEFFTELGCAACGAMSMLSDEQVPCSCEADVNGTITQLLLQAISGEAAFGTDVVSFDLEEDLVAVWHCGLAPLSMADPQVAPRGTIHSNRQLPLLMEFPLKPGPVTVARLSEAGHTGTFQLTVGRGQMVRAPLSYSGTSGVMRFEHHAAQILDTIVRQGLEHHISITYGDHLDALLALAQMLGLPVLRL